MKREYDDDDGETIVSMDVDGMPWYDPRRAALKTGGSEGASDKQTFTKEEVRAYRFAAIEAALLVVAVFALVFGLFIAFCDFVLFR